MLFLTSPAKSLDFDTPYKAAHVTTPHFLADAKILAKHLKKLSRLKLIKTLSVSRELAILNYNRFQVWEKEQAKNARPAIFAYHGVIYRELSPHNYTASQNAYLQTSLRIISGLYGLLRPFDLIAPYRLEMNANLKIGSATDLYEYWGEKLTQQLNVDIMAHQHEYLLNLASQEYIQAIQPSHLSAPFIDIEFNQRKGKEVFNYGLLARQARGKMIDYLTMHEAKNLETVKKFRYDGYKLTAETSTKFVFTKEL